MVRKLWSFVHQSYLVVAFSIGVVIGAIVALVFRVNYFGSIYWLVLVLIVLLVIYLRPRLAFMGIALIMGMILMFFRVTAELTGENYIRQLWGQTVIVTGVVEADPNSDEKGTKFKISNLKFSEEMVETRGSIYISIKYNDEIRRSDEIKLTGRLSEGFGTYAGYMYMPKIEIIRKSNNNAVLDLRDWFAERIRKLVPEPEVDLGLSYLLGMKTGLPDDLDENLRAVGLTHIVVASGAHLSILVEIARKFFGKVSRMAGLVLSIMFVVLFMAMVGWTPSILRAGVMAILTLVMWYAGRKIAPWRLILIVMAFTLILNPMFIINLGWLLSFASYAGIMILGPSLAKFFYGTRKPGFIGSMILVTVSATLMTLPITLYYFGAVSLISVVANLLILPTLSVAMGLTFMTGIIMGIPGVETVFQFMTVKLLDYHIAVVKFFGGMRQFMIEIAPYQVWVFWLYAIIVIPVAFFLTKRMWYNKKHERNEIWKH